MLFRRSFLFVAVWFTAVGISAWASAQDGDGPPPPPEGDPVDAAHFEGEFRIVQEQATVLGPDGKQRTFATQRRVPVPPRSGYRSNTLGGTFLAQWMYIRVNGQTHTFWGARALSLDVQSPLRTLGMRSGDVVTRLDGTPIWVGMHQRNGVWQIPELEEHFGTTDVRFILQGTNRVRVGQIVLDFHDDDNGFQPLLP